MFMIIAIGGALIGFAVGVVVTMVTYEILKGEDKNDRTNS